MPYKLCPNCYGISYSSSEKGEWKCPECDTDLTNVEITESKPQITKP